MKLKDVIHLYIGQNVLRPDNKTILPIYGIQGSLVVHNEKYELTYSGIAGCRLMLRPMDSMSKTEGNEIFGEDMGGDNMFTPEEFIKLLSYGFDLFGLIDSGEAINSLTYFK